MWTLNDALEVIRLHQSKVKEFHYHLGLIGSVLNNGKSENDLDIVVLPLGGEIVPLRYYLIKYLSTISSEFINAKDTKLEEDETKYEDDNNYEVFKAKLDGKNVDWFIFQ